MTEDKPRVLVVDDETKVRELFCRSLEETLSVTVVEAKDGIEALEMLRASNFDLVITDLVMPRMEGQPLFETLAKERPKLPVLVVTGHPKDDTYIASLECNVVDYLAKPLRPAELTRRVASLLQIPPEPSESS